MRVAVLSAAAEAAKPGRGKTMVGQVAQALIAKGEARGLAKGEAKGEAKGLANSLRQLLEHRFGPLAQAVLGRIESASPAELGAWFKAALNATSLAAVFEGRGSD